MRVTSKLKQLWRDRSAVSAVVVALGLVPLVAATGLAVDTASIYILKSRLSKSIDSAALASGRIALSADAEAVAQQYFVANFGATGSRIELSNFAFNLDDTRRFVTVSANATFDTTFLRILGPDKITVSSRTVIEREVSGMELALVLDNTGSMHGTAFSTMQQAAYDLIDIVFAGGSEPIDNLWVSLVPYTATVNIGPHRTGWLVQNDRALTTGGFPTAAPWKGCVEARPYPLDSTDATPSVQRFTSFYYAPTERTQDNNWPPLKTAITHRNDGRGPNLGCGSAITPLTSSRQTIDAAIGAMGAWHRGGTTGNLGLSWGWRTISPQWRGLWGGETPENHPLDYDAPHMQKVVVILTDGNNQFHDNDPGAGTPRSDYTAYGRLEALGVTSLQAGRAILDNRMSETCAAMKANGILIYSIIFGASPDATARNLFRSCATTTGMYFYAPSNKSLEDAFRSIGGELASLRIVE